VAVAEQPKRPEQRFERRMSDFEALMWNVENDPWLNPNGGNVLILDQPIDVDDFRARIAYSVAEVPRLRERVVPTLGRLSPPLWRPDPEFDLSFHIRTIALPPPGSMRQLLDLVESLYQDPYDRSRPLWQFFVIDGLEDGKGALFWKIHHAISDGIGMGYLSEYHLSRDPDAETPPQVDLDALVAAAVAVDQEGEGERPSLPAAILNTAGHAARRQAGIARRLTAEMVMMGSDPYRMRDVVENVAGTVTGTVQTVRSQMLGSGETPGGSPLWKQRSRRRHLELLSVPLEPVKAAAKALGGSVNDVFVAGAVNGSLLYHDRRGVPVDALNLSFVVSTRTEAGIGGNSFAPTRLQVPGDPMSPAERLTLVSQLMGAKRAEVLGGGGGRSGNLTGLAGIANLLPTSLVTRVARSQAVKQDFATSNVRGPFKPRYIGKAKVIGNYGFGPLAGTAFNLTTLSYTDKLWISLHADPVAIEAPGELRDDLETAYRELIAAGGIVT